MYKWMMQQDVVWLASCVDYCARNHLNPEDLTDFRSVYMRCARAIRQEKDCDIDSAMRMVAALVGAFQQKRRAVG